MGHSTNSPQNSLLLPAMDFSMLLIVIVFGTAGLGWLTTWSHSSGDDGSESAISKEEMKHQIEAKKRRFDELANEQDAMATEASTLEKQLKQAQARHPDAAQMRLDPADGDIRELENQLRRDRKYLRERTAWQAVFGEERLRCDQERTDFEQQLTQLQQRLHEFEKKKRDLQQTKEFGEQFRQRLEEIDQQLRESVALNTRFRKEIADHKQRPPKQQTITIDTRPRFGKEASHSHVLYVSLFQGKVTPVGKPYFTTTDNLDGTRTEVMSRTGPDARQALADGSEFMQLLDQIDREKHHVFLWVDSSSFETFRAVRAELRRRQIDCGWMPLEDRQVVIGKIEDGFEVGTQ